MRHVTATADFAPTRSQAGGQPTLFHRLQQAWIVRRQRRALLALDDRMLADVGLSRTDAYREAQRPFLDVPGAACTNTW